MAGSAGPYKEGNTVFLGLGCPKLFCGAFIQWQNSSTCWNKIEPMLNIYRNFTEVFKAYIHKFEFIHSRFRKNTVFAHWGLFWSCHRLTKASWSEVSLPFAQRCSDCCTISPKVSISVNNTFKLKLKVNLKWKHRLDKQLIRSLY